RASGFATVPVVHTVGSTSCPSRLSSPSYPGRNALSQRPSRHVLRVHSSSSAQSVTDVQKGGSVVVVDPPQGEVTTQVCVQQSASSWLPSSQSSPVRSGGD